LTKLYSLKTHDTIGYVQLLKRRKNQKGDDTFAALRHIVSMLLNNVMFSIFLEKKLLMGSNKHLYSGTWQVCAKYNHLCKILATISYGM